MRRNLFALWFAIVCGCSSARDAHIASDGDATFTPPSRDDAPVVHAPASPLANVRVLLAGQGVLDASTDKGGGIWAVTASTVYYFRAGASTPVTYDQSSGLARGWRTWQDTYYSANAPTTLPVTFSAIAGAAAGEAIVGNVGAIADRVNVDPARGAVVRVDNMKVTARNRAAAKS